MKSNEIHQKLVSSLELDRSSSSSHSNSIYQALSNEEDREMSYTDGTNSSKIIKQEVEEEKIDNTEAKLDAIDKSWKALIIMLTSLTLALGCALAHHGMNASLNGKPVAGNISQQWASRFGTALAFLAKMLFVICVATAFVQWQWLILSTRHQPIRIKDFDTLTHGMSNVFSLFSSYIWLKQPTLLVVALISWALQLVAVVTPGTLSIELQPFTNMNELSVPQLSLNYTKIIAGQAASIFQPNSTSFLSGVWESSSAMKAAFATATQGKIIEMNSANSNQTYSLQFLAPALNCGKANTSMLNTLAQVYSNSPGQFDLLSWTGNNVPWISLGNTSLLAPQDIKNVTYWPVLFDESYSFSNLDLDDIYGNVNEAQGNSLWIASKYGWSTLPKSNITWVNVTECRLFNASYEVEFSFQNFQQNTTIKRVEYHNPVWLTLDNTTNLTSQLGPNDIPNTPDAAKIWTLLTYKTLMSAMGNIFVGYTRWNWTTPAHLERLSTHADTTMIDLTTSEGMSNGMQELFGNITMSLFTYPDFLADSPGSVPVTITNWMTTYSYEPRDLLITYGLAFLFSLACCMLGLYAFRVSANSYQNNFSTYIRAVAGSNLDIKSVIPESDTGAGPLPRELDRKVITFNIHQSDESARSLSVRHNHEEKEP